MVPNNKVRTIITFLLIKQDLCNLPNLQKYLKPDKKASGKVNIGFKFSGAEISRSMKEEQLREFV